MNKKEFLEKMAMALAGQVPDSVVEENVSYYDTYISDEMAKGASLEAVLESLGDPRLIARSIIEANGGGSDMAGVYEDSDSGRTGYHSHQDSGSTETEFREEERPAFHGFRLNGLWALLIFIAMIVLVIWVVGGIFTLLSPIMVPLMLILLVYWIFKGPRRY